VPKIYENKEISINYVTTGIQWNRHEINVDDIFAYNLALNVINDNEDQEPEGEKNHKKGGLNCVFGNFFFYVLDNCPQFQSLK